MQIHIKADAMRILLYTLLSCRCPISGSIEEEIVTYYISHKNDKYIDYRDVLEIADKMKCETPFHRLKEFIIYNINEPGQELFIATEDVLRHFATMFHWRMVERKLSTSYKMIIQVPSWFVSHMLLPVVIKKEDGQYMAEYTHKNRIISLRNIFIPNDIQVEQNTRYAIHLGFVVAPLDRFSFKMVSHHLEEIPLFCLFREDFDFIDFAKFQRFGDYRELCRARYKKYFE